MQLTHVKPLNGGSDKYGDCELCGKFVASAYIARLDVSEIETTKGKRVFGHRECIECKQWK